MDSGKPKQKKGVGKKDSKDKKRRIEPSSSDDGMTEENQEVDKGLVLQVPQKEYVRKSSQRSMEDLSSRQMAYVLAGLGLCMPSDLVEETILLETAARYRKQKDKAGETGALQKAGFAW
ncbi:unnamed protein product [Symbiodinium sp. CCMP2592]|nr:unnamed protein product [Symbiodinium sp. CCMP2592]